MILKLNFKGGDKGHKKDCVSLSKKNNFVYSIATFGFVWFAFVLRFQNWKIKSLKKKKKVQEQRKNLLLSIKQKKLKLKLSLFDFLSGGKWK